MLKESLLLLILELNLDPTKIDIKNYKKLDSDECALIPGFIIDSAFLYNVKKYHDRQDSINNSNKHVSTNDIYSYLLNMILLKMKYL